MTRSRDQLIDALATSAGQVRPYLPARLSLLWWLCSWLLVVAIAVWLSPLRSGWHQQVMSSPRFALELLLGVSASVAIALCAIQAAIPAGNSRKQMGIAIFLATAWLLSYVVGLWWPALEPSAAGGRYHCHWQAFSLGIPPVLLGVYLLRKGFVLNWAKAGLGLGVAAALMPALLMQIACMYAPAHILQYHIAPALSFALMIAVLGWWLQKTKDRG